ncbi:hypothetical protein WNB94_16925 [Aquabacterium sp. A3]|uniref:hypothetical protein n=1 Tax=Aquabacterium sp. A3 TaxID=3132829 RepID=UPI00311A8091
MRTLRKLAAAASFVALLLTLLFASQLALVPHTVENGALISRAFSASAAFIKSFQAANRRLPNDDEFATWKAQQKGVLPMVEGVKLTSPNNLPLDAQEVFGAAPAGSFALSLWRGEWHEHYAPWSQESTVDNPAGLYASTIGLVLIAGFSTVALWKFAKSGSAS